MTVQSRPRYKESFSSEQKEKYRLKKESEKQEIHALYKNFLEKKSIKDIIGIISNYKQLHNYSLRNRFLVLSQAEDREDKKFVGILKSFLNWKKQDIQVLKGSKAYKVLVPIFSKKQDEENKTISTPKSHENQKTQEKTLHFFKLGNMFDISATSEYENYLKEQNEIDQKIMKNQLIPTPIYG